jgi:hypothetical protein
MGVAIGSMLPCTEATRTTFKKMRTNKRYVTASGKIVWEQPSASDRNTSAVNKPIDWYHDMGMRRETFHQPIRHSQPLRTQLPDPTCKFIMASIYQHRATRQYLQYLWLNTHNRDNSDDTMDQQPHGKRSSLEESYTMSLKARKRAGGLDSLLPHL